MSTTRFRSKSVAVKPGLIRRTWIPHFDHSARIDSVKPATANLLAEYSDRPGKARRATIEPMLHQRGALALPQEREQGPGRLDEREDVDLEDPTEDGWVVGVEVAGGADPGGVDDEVEGSEAVGGGVDDLAPAFLLGQVGVDGEDGLGPRAFEDEVPGGRFQSGERSAGQEDACSRPDQMLGDGPTQARRGSRHEAASPFERPSRLHDGRVPGLLADGRIVEAALGFHQRDVLGVGLAPDRNRLEVCPTDGGP